MCYNTSITKCSLNKAAGKGERFSSNTIERSYPTGIAGSNPATWIFFKGENMSTVWFIFKVFCIVYSLFLLFFEEKHTILSKFVIFSWIFILGTSFAEYKFERAGWLKFNGDKQKWEVGGKFKKEIQSQMSKEAHAIISNYKRMERERIIKEGLFSEVLKEGGKY